MNVSKTTTGNRRARQVRTMAILTALTLGLILFGGLAQAGEPNHQAVNFTLYYPVGTNQDPDVTTNFRLSLIYGRVGAVRGVDLNTGVSIVQRDVQGLQATILYSEVRGRFSGLAVTGLMNRFQDDVTGVQIAGLTNINNGRMTGVQYAPLFNFVGGGLSGVQMATVFNSTKGDGGFLQLAGVANTHEGDFRGLQIGGANFTTSRIAGAQIGVVNMAMEVRGLQAGPISIAGEAHGVQLGALNIARRNEGVPVGLINIDEEAGGVDWIIQGSNLAAVSTGVRTTVNNWYSVFSTGYGDQQGDVEDSLFLGWNYGYGFRLGRAWTLGADLGFVHIIPRSQDDPTLNDALHFAVQARLLIEARLGRNEALFAGGGVSSIYSDYSSSAQQETEPHVVLGISLF